MTQPRCPDLVAKLERFSTNGHSICRATAATYVDHPSAMHHVAKEGSILLFLKFNNEINVQRWCFSQHRPNPSWGCPTSRHGRPRQWPPVVNTKAAPMIPISKWRSNKGNPNIRCLLTAVVFCHSNCLQFLCWDRSCEVWQQVASDTRDSEQPVRAWGAKSTSHPFLFHWHGSVAAGD